jgi:hypothetical protein
MGQVLGQPQSFQTQVCFILSLDCDTLDVESPPKAHMLKAWSQAGGGGWFRLVVV